MAKDEPKYASEYEYLVKGIRLNERDKKDIIVLYNEHEIDVDNVNYNK
jgi:hypothetical protein